MKKNKETIFINRELSWLSFNERVLQEAEDKAVPLIERIKFLAIYSNNMDEFFRVRVATLKRLLKLPGKSEILMGMKASDLLDQIQKTVIRQQEDFDTAYQAILKELAQENIFIVNEKQLTNKQGEFVKKYFRDNVMPSLFPVMLDAVPDIPSLRDRSVYLIVKLSRKRKTPTQTQKSKYAILEIPTDTVPRFTVLPSDDNKTYITLLDDVIRYNLESVFTNFDHDIIEAYTIKLTRDAELDIDDDLSKSLVEKITKSINDRKKGQPVRLVYDETIPEVTLSYLMKKLKLRKSDNLIPGGRYHNFKDFISFPNVGKPSLVYKKSVPHTHPDLVNQPTLFKIIKRKDILLTYPYQSFDHIIDLLREASIDQKVRSIKITLYRVSKISNVVKALINALKNGKEVTVVIELQARFDEENNIYWAGKLQEEGAKIIYGVPGLKVHSKIFLIERKEDNSIVKYAHIGTGNFNGDTARIYTDHSLLTADKRITDDLEQVFDFYSDNFKLGKYNHLLVSPFTMRKSFIALIDKEIKNAKAKKKASIIIKLNNLVDNVMIKKLYDASKAGVAVKLIIRGTCSVKPGVKNLSDNIEGISIVDKFLEHSRVFIFHNGGEEKYFISSADWMTRNLDYRSEVATPIYSKEIQLQIKNMMNLMLADSVKARILGEQQDNQYKKSEGNKTPVRSQEAIYNLLTN